MLTVYYSKYLLVTIFFVFQRAEMDSMQLVEEVKNLGEKKAELEQELLTTGRENLEWQKKVQLSCEMKEDISKQFCENGDIGAMKNEIHRMEVRAFVYKLYSNSFS